MGAVDIFMYTYSTITFRWPYKPLILTAVSFNLTAIRRDSGSVKTDGKLQRKLSQKSTVLKTRLAQIQALYRKHSTYTIITPNIGKNYSFLSLLCETGLCRILR